MNRFLILLLSFFLFCHTSYSQQKTPPFWSEIQGFKKTDSVSAPAKGAILFVGSSSFRNWQDVQDYFPDRKIINRGFGGSSLPDVIRYADDIIFPYQPKQIVIYCGENDLAGSDSITAQTVYGRFVHLFQLVRSKMPKVPIVFVSIKPSPSRAHLMPKMVATNKLVKDFLKKQKRTKYVDVYTPMLTPDGKPMEDIFVGDKLHMNAKGYAIWKKALEPALKK